MSDGFSLDAREFERALNLVLDNTKRDAPTYLNKKALMVIIGGKGVQGAMRLTPRAKAADIRAIPVETIARIVMARARANGEKLTRAEIAKRIKRERARRMSSIGYTAGPGWHQAAVAFGGRGVRRLRKDYSKSRAAKGRGKIATPSSLFAEIVNTAPAASKIGERPLQQAVNNVAADMAGYGASELLKRNLEKASAK